MIYEKLDNMIALAIKDAAHAANSQEAEAVKITLEVYRAVKTEFSTAGYNATHIPTEEQEIVLLNEMIAKRRKTAGIYEKAGEKQRAANELGEVDIITNLLPVSARPTNPEDVKNEAQCVIKTFVELKAIEDPSFNPKQIQRYTKDIISKVKEKYPDAENSIIAGCVQAYAKS